MEYSKYRKKSNEGLRKKSLRENDEFSKEEKREQNEANGYEASTEEKVENLEPVGTSLISTEGGNIYFGVNRKKDVSVVFSSRRTSNKNDKRKRLKSTYSKDVSRSSQSIYTNYGSNDDSAASVRVSLDKDKYGIDTKIKKAAGVLKDNEVMQDSVPYLYGETDEKKSAEKTSLSEKDTGEKAKKVTPDQNEKAEKAKKDEELKAERQHKERESKKLEQEIEANIEKMKEKARKANIELKNNSSVVTVEQDVLDENEDDENGSNNDGNNGDNKSEEEIVQKTDENDENVTDNSEKADGSEQN